MRAPAAAPDALARDHPEWGPWLAVLGQARPALNDAPWVHVSPESLGAPAPPPAPLLHEAAITVGAREANLFVRRLFAIAGAGSAPVATLGAAARDDRLDVPGLLEAAICQDAQRLDEWAHHLGVEPAALWAVATVAATPLLHACRRTVGDRRSPAWTHGWCPVCGAWPTLAEARGLERSRQLRCARCGSDWRTDWLRCPYCGNANHSTQGSLVADASMETRKVETCEVCRGYLKTLTTLRPTPADAVALIDLATVDLDVAALEHGYSRPAEPARRMSVRVVAATA